MGGGGGSMRRCARGPMHKAGQRNAQGCIHVSPMYLVLPHPPTAPHHAAPTPTPVCQVTRRPCPGLGHTSSCSPGGNSSRATGLPSAVLQAATHSGALQAAVRGAPCTKSRAGGQVGRRGGEEAGGRVGWRAVWPLLVEAARHQPAVMAGSVHAVQCSCGTWKYLCWKKSAPHLRWGQFAHSWQAGSSQPRRLGQGREAAKEAHGQGTEPAFGTAGRSSLGAWQCGCNEGGAGRWEMREAYGNIKRHFHSCLAPCFITRTARKSSRHPPHGLASRSCLTCSHGRTLASCPLHWHRRHWRYCWLPE